MVVTVEWIKEFNTKGIRNKWKIEVKNKVKNKHEKTVYDNQNLINNYLPNNY